MIINDWTLLLLFYPMFSMTEGANKFPYADNLCGGYESLYGIQAQFNDGGMQGCADTCTGLASLVV